MKQQSEKMLAGGFVLVLLMLGGVATSAYLSVQQLIASRQSVEHTFEVLDALDRISSSSTAIASGRYGYVISRQKTYLQDYQTGLQGTKQAIADVRLLSSDNPKQQLALARVEPLVAKRTALAQQSIALLERGQSNEAIQAELSKQSWLLGQEVRLALTTMKDEERRLLAQRKRQTDDTVHQVIVVNGVGYLLGFSLLVGVFLILYRQIRIRQRAETALQKHAEEVSDLYNRAPCGYHSLDAAGLFIRINDTELNWLGYTRDEVLHKKNFTALVTPQNLAVFQENFPKFKVQGWINDVEFDLIRKDGTILPVSLSATAINDAAGNFLMSRSTLFDISDRRRIQAALQQANEQLEARVQDRTAALSQVNALLHSELRDRKLAEAALRESEQRLSLAVEGSGMATWDINLQTGKALWSAQHFILLGYEPEPSGEATLSMWQRCVHPDDLEPVTQLAEQAIQTRSLYHSEHRIRRVDNGQIVWLAAFGRAFYDQAGQAVRFLGIILDISDRKQAEQALQQVNDALEMRVQERTAALKQLNEDLGRSNQELEQFAYVASHDLQEPLRAVMGYTQLLMQDYQVHFDATAHQYAEYIVDGAKRMQQLIQDLLHYSRVGTRDLVFAPTDCNTVLEQVLGNLQVSIVERHAIITSDPLPTISVDKLQLTQLFQNLIGNAIKFCRDDVPRVHISARWVEEQGEQGEQGEQFKTQNSKLSSHTPRPTSHTPHPQWLFSVRDNGIGIKPRYLERIFEIFKRLHTRTEFSGTGIGLAICKKIVDRHGGHIWAESESGTGTTFYFTLPYHDHTDV